MPMYHSKIEIKHEPQVIKYTRTEQYYEKRLTLSGLRKYVNEDEWFEIIQNDENLYGKIITLEIYGQRLETEKERSERVAKEKRYMENYYRFHAKQNK